LKAFTDFLDKDLNNAKCLYESDFSTQGVEKLTAIGNSTACNSTHEPDTGAVSVFNFIADTRDLHEPSGAHEQNFN